MKKDLWVISLGGSRIIPEDVDYKFIEEFKSLIERNKHHKFAVVTGGGSTARRYMKALKKIGKRTKDQSLVGISITRLHASFLARIFGKEANEIIPQNMKKVENLLKKNQVVFCGALRYKDENTSDGTAADLAGYLGCSFINITNVKGLYDKNPKTNKNAKFIKKISWKSFYQMANKIKFEAGQHFALDQQASNKIMQKKIPTYIINNLNDLEKIINGKKFSGTLIQD
ncbi:MAG: UMP kinase [Nanoarchaeota archaeon]